MKNHKYNIIDHVFASMEKHLFIYIIVSFGFCYDLYTCGWFLLARFFKSFFLFDGSLSRFDLFF